VSQHARKVCGRALVESYSSPMAIVRFPEGTAIRANRRLRVPEDHRPGRARRAGYHSVDRHRTHVV